MEVLRAKARVSAVMEGSRSCRRRSRGRPIWQGLKQIKKQPVMSEPKLQPIPQDAVISFVEELEKADQYFELKYYLADLDGITENWYIPDKLRDDIVDNLKGDLRFKKLDQEDINHALNCLNGVLQFQRYSNLQYIRDADRSIWEIDWDWDWDWDELISTCKVVLSKDVDEATIDGVFPLFGLVEELDEFVSSNPIFTLVLQTRNKMQGRCLDPEPKVELLELKESSPFYYYDVIAEEHTYKAKTVTFTYEACGASVEDIKSSLSAVGKIFSVCINRLDTHSEMAHVTFKDLTEANKALGLAAKGKLKIADQLVGVIPTKYNTPPCKCKFPYVKPEHVEAAMSGVEKLEDELFADAMNRYSKLVEKANRGRSASALSGQAESAQKGTELPDGVETDKV